MDLSPKPEPSAEPTEPDPGGPDAPSHEPTGVVRDIRASNPPTGADASNGMGVSSEWIGRTGPGQHATDGIKDTSVGEAAASGDDTAPEQRPGNDETNPVGIRPKAGYPSADPRSED